MKINVRLSSKGETRSIIYRISIRIFEEIEPNESYPLGKKYRQLDYSTSLSVKLKDWDSKKRITKNDSYKNGQIANGLTRVMEIGSKLASDNSLNLKSLREALNTDHKLNEIFNKDRKIITTDEYIAPFNFIEQYIIKSNVSPVTKKDYNNTLNHLRDYDSYRGKSASWKSMGYEYYLDLVSYLKGIGKKGSTIDKIIKNLKVFLTQADLSDNIEVNQDFKKTVSGKSLFAKVNKDETEHVYLNETEIKQITDAKMDHRLSEIRDLFIIGCWTGLRISDLSKLKTENINDGLLRIKTQKTKEGVVIPVTDELQKVLNKYPDRLPKIPTDQHYNRQVKDVCKIAGLDLPIMAEVRRGNLTVTAPVPKYELITSHTARRSFATNLYRRGIPSTQLMFLTGHRTEDAFLRYIKVSKEDNAKDVAKKLKKIG
ncbi:MAG: site-specific integrase [Bacteroidales bacterium]|nr:site-specific integrase [Bacteroidales bacterium]